MKTLILPGFSVNNKSWAKEVAKNLDKETIIHNWLHWENSKSNLNLKEELKNIVSEVGVEKINIIAKSVGTMVAMHLIKIISGNIHKIILCGIPSVSQERKKLFETSLSDFETENIIVFQNTKDPFASFTEVKAFVYSINPKIEVIQKPRSDHNYPYFQDFGKIV